MNKKYSLIIIFAILFSCTIATTNNNSVYARAKESWGGVYGEISKKANMTGVVRCYNGGKMIKTIDNISNFDNISDITTNDTDTNYIALPSGLTNVGDDAVSCAELYKQDSYGTGGSFSGVFTLSGKPEYSGGLTGDGSKATLLTGMGYVLSNNGRSCVQYRYKLKTTGLERTTRTLCMENGKLDLQGSSNMGTPAALSFSISADNTTLTISGTGNTALNGQAIPTRIDYSQYPSWTLFVAEINSILAEKYNPLIIQDLGTSYTYDLITEPNENEISGSTYSLSNQKVSYLEAIKFIAGYESYNDLMFSKTEQLQYFIGVLRSFYNVDVACGVDPSFLPDYTPIKIDISGSTLHKSDNCYVKPQENADKKAHGFTDSSDPNYKLFDANGAHGLSFAGVINEINKLADSMDDADLSGLSTSGAASDDPCLSSGAAGNMGWLICNILKVAQEATEGIYNDAVVPLLQVKPELFAGNSSTREAWSIFQGFANILFVIFFLFVIFSQLTGIGIDNYGIKKILPKMIIAAVLINLSYLLCQIGIDLSNILGNGIQSMFDSMDPTVTAPGVTGINAGTEMSVFLASALTVGIVAKAVILNPAILLGLFVGVLGVLIAIFFVFILLSMRQAALVVLTVISPVAFVLYMLPNTKKLFDKWFKAIEGLLLLYPICALLIAGGDFVSRLLLSVGYAADNIWGSLVAMVVGIVPIFFIPTVLKSSFTALGGIGATVSNFGNRLRSGATTGIKKSEGYKNLQATGQRRRIRMKAGRDKEGNLTSIGRAKAHIAQSGVGKILYGKTFAGYSEAAEKYRQEDIQAASTIDSSLVQSELAEHPELTPRSIYDQRLGDAIKNKKSTSDIFAIIDAAKSAGVKPKDIAAMTRKHLDGDSIPGMSPGERSNFLRQFANRYGNDFLKKDYEQKSWAMSGGMGYSTLAQKMADTSGKGQTAQKLSGYANGNIDIDDMKDEDVAALSTENLADLIDKKKISSEQAQRIWASNSNMDDTNRLMLGAYGSDSHIALTKDEAKDAVAGKSYSKGLTQDMVTAFTRRAAEAVVLEDVKKRNVQDGSNRQSDPLETTNSSNPYEWGGGTGSGGGS